METQNVLIEDWRPIEGYEGLYEVSNQGRIKSLVKRNTIFLKQIKRPHYYSVQLYKNNKGKLFYVHKIVAKAFPDVCGEWFDKCEVDHIDTNHLNNYASNLKVVTTLENHNNPLTKKHISESRKVIIPWNKGKTYKCEAISVALKKRNMTMDKNNNAKPILQYSKNGEFIKEWSCGKDAIDSLNLCQSSLSNNLNGRQKTCGGYIFKFKNCSQLL